MMSTFGARPRVDACTALAAAAERTPAHDLDLRGLPAADQIELWHGVARHGFTLGGRAETPLDVVLSAARVDTLVVSRFASRAHVAVRPEPLVRRSPARFVKLRLYERGGARLLHGSESHALGPGAVHVVDHSRSWSACNADHAQLAVFVPHTLLGFEAARQPLCTSLPLGEARGAILADAIRSLDARLPALTAAEAPFVAAGFAGLVRGLLGGGVDDPADAATGAARARAMRAYIERHLRDPDLGADHLCSAFATARATVYRAFADEGGVARYLVRRRLERAHLDLADAVPARGVVQRVAEGWGFHSVSHFSQAFQAQFGLRPSEVVGVAHAAAAPPPSPRPGDAVPASVRAAGARLAELYGWITSL